MLDSENYRIPKNNVTRNKGKKGRIKYEILPEYW
jgi:hypothetical protein